MSETATRKPQPRKASIPLDDNTDILQKTEPIVSPIDIISKVNTNINQGTTEADIDAEYNPIERELGRQDRGNFQKDANMYNLPEDNPAFVLEKVEIPLVRKVAIKKISRFNFRIGLERSPEQFKVMPGCTHRWMCDKKGNEFITGLEDKPDVRKRLERALRVDLSNTSDFYATLNFAMEDKEHGQIMNFDDIQMGPYYEVVYHAMLASALIANGLHEYSSGKKPLAEWYIENKEAEAEAKELDMTYDIEAMETFGTISLSKRQGIAKLLKLNVWGTTEKVSSLELWEFVKKSSENAKTFLEIARMQPERLNVSILVNNAIKTNVLRRNKANDLTFANEVLGPTEDHVISKLVLPTNATLRLAIERQVTAKQL